MDTRVCKGIWILEHSRLSGYLSIVGNMDTRVYFGNMDSRERKDLTLFNLKLLGKFY